MMNLLYFTAGIFFLTAGILNLTAVYIIYPLIVKSKNKKQKTENNEVSECANIENKYSFCIIIPFYNEFGSITKKLSSIHSEFISNTNSEIILVNDGNAEFNIEQFKETNSIVISEKKIRIYKLSKNYGKLFAMYFAAKTTNADYLLFTDSNSIFKEDYFENLLNSINSENPDISGGLLQYRTQKQSALSENVYWSAESKLKIAEQRADFFTLGLYGSNIIIKRNLYLTHPCYIFCDFSLPLYYQTVKNKKIKLNEKLIVYEELPLNSFREIFKIKKRIIHHALFGLHKLFTVSKMDARLIEQLYFHKISRWFTPYWLIMIICGITLVAGLAGLKIVSAVLLILLMAARLTGFNIKYLLSLNCAAFCAILSFCINPALERWTPSKKN